MIGVSESHTDTSWIGPNGEQRFHGLLSAFRRLDDRLALLLAAAHSSEAELDSQTYPGLTISRSESLQLLGREPGSSAFVLDEGALQTQLFDPLENDNAKLTWLAREYELSAFDQDVILIALATELDLRYEKLFAYLQDDITCKRPTVDLVLSLLCPSTRTREARRMHFMPDGLLIRNKLLHLTTDSDQGRSMPARQIRLDEGVVNLLLGGKGLDRRLASCCALVEPDRSLADVPINDDLKRALQVLIAEPERQPFKLHFRGPLGTGKRETAEALAAGLGLQLLAVDIEELQAISPNFDDGLKLVFREARFRRALTYLENFEFLTGEARAVFYRRFLKAVNEDSSLTLLAGAESLGLTTKIHEVVFPVPSFAQRRTCWHEQLRQHGIALDEATLDALASGFHLSYGEIVTAISRAIDQAQWRAAGQTEAAPAGALKSSPTAQDLFACARARLSHNLGQFARKIDPKYDWSDLVLPTDQLSQLREMCARHKHQHLVYDKWEFGKKLSLGKGINALYSGHPGTGKTMAAEIIANELTLDLYKIDLSQVISKYIGETEKSLNRIFKEAQAGSAILFFDEADAIFGKRTEVKDSHDRYANIEVSYLLQKMEEYDGIAILATNLRQNIDVAFLRRMQFIVEFPFPDEEHRKRIWEVVFPREAPIAGDVDFDMLARSIRLAGANLKSIGLAAAFSAAGDGGVIQQQHVIRAARREFQKLGQSWNESDRHPEERSDIRRKSETVEPDSKDD
jgi:SpoVK/Ycf46/Vps4 family AAA+-type ATPase